MEYVDQGANYYEEQYRKKVVSNLKRRAESLGFTLLENTQTLSAAGVS